MIKANGYVLLGILAITGCKTTNSSSGDSDSESGLEASGVAASRFSVEWSCKTAGDKSLNPPQRLLFTKDSAEKGGYLVTLFDTRDLFQNMQFFGKGTISSEGNGNVTLFDGSTIMMANSGGRVVTSVQLQILECIKGNASTWANTVGTPGAVFSCGGGDTKFVVSKVGSGYKLDKEVAKLERQSNGDLKFATATKKSITIQKQAPGMYGGLYDNGSPSEKEGLPCIGSATLL